MDKLEKLQEYAKSVGFPGMLSEPETILMINYADHCLSEQWKPYPENKPVKDGDYLCSWSHYGNPPETAELKNGVWYGGEYGLRLEEPTHFMEIPKLPI